MYIHYFLQCCHGEKHERQTQLLILGAEQLMVERDVPYFYLLLLSAVTLVLVGCSAVVVF